MRGRRKTLNAGRRRTFDATNVTRHLRLLRAVLVHAALVRFTLGESLSQLT